MTVPVLLQFLSTVYKWVRLEKKEDKKWSWLILLLQFWPQWRAIRIMRLDWKNDPRTEDKKKELMREVTTTEPFLEAWPSIIIMTIIWLSALNDTSFTYHCVDKVAYISHKFTIGEYDDTECNHYRYSMYHLFSVYDTTKYCTNHPESIRCVVYGGFGGMPWFFTTFAISVITGALGITKFLQVGPFSILTSKGALSGMCKCRFLLAFIAVIASMVTKFTMVGLLFYVLLDSRRGFQEIMEILGTSEYAETIIRMLLLLAGLLILPNLLFSLISIYSSTGFNKKLTEVILAYPAVWMLPIATYFIIGPRKLSCCSETNTHTYHLGFSRSYTIINIILTVIMYTVIFVYFAIYTKGLLLLIATYFSPVLFLSLICNIIFLLSEVKCCCSCCCDTECHNHETYVIATNTVKLDIVKIED